MMSVAQRMQHVLHRVIGLPVVMDYDADHAGGANPIEGQKSSRGDVQPLGLAAEAKTCFVQVFDLRAAYFLAPRIDQVFKSTGARTAHPGNGCRDQADGEEIAHQLGQAVLRQEMSVQEINDHRANPRAVLYRCRHPCGERCLGSLAALRAGADMGAMLSNDRRTWLGHVKYLPRGMARGHCCHQRRPTVDANISATARNAVAQGLLASAGGGQKQITERGEAVVGALPDRDKVKAALEEYKIRKPRK